MEKDGLPYQSDEGINRRQDWKAAEADILAAKAELKTTAIYMWNQIAYWEVGP